MNYWIELTTDTMIRVFTAFSGYDSQCMALDRVGIDYDLVGWSEIDRYAVAAHNAVYPQYAGRNFGDISKIDWAQVPDFDLFTYSSPCQDFSIAGKQHGGEKWSGTRSSLLWECERAIAYKRPKYLLFENVSALVSNKFIRLFNDWQLTLERLGYTNFTQVLNAKDYGVPQNRERVFMVSVLNCDKPFYFPETIPLRKCLRDVLEQ
ncbi:MAG: DNA (cytosine-5-)-methyltransferase, partial [Elusimicrobiales bacterium]|nr:DNA (cytosine-5-)-methyltransferase [Elusimicrobiales bacterium]